MNKFKQVAPLLLVALGIQAFLLSGIKFTAWPEMLLWPYLNLHGWMLYKDIAIAHSPLLIWFLDGFYKIFGVGVLQLKIFTWILIFVIDIAVYFVAKKLWNQKLAIITIFFFILWQVFYDGNGLWFDLFMGLFAFVSYYFGEKGKWFWAGIFFGLAIISKQTAVYFLLPIFFSKPDYRKLIAGIGTVFILFFLLLEVFHIAPSFYDWAIKFGIFELPRAQGQTQLPDLKNLAISLFPFVVFVPLFLVKRSTSIKLSLWALAGMMGTYPRFEYFHFQPAIPYLAITSMVVFTSKWNKNDLVKAFIPVYVLIGLYLFGGFWMRNWGEGVRFFEPDVLDTVNYVKSHTSAGDDIFVLNYWDSVYALSNTFPATRPWVPQLSWYMERPGIQEKMIKDLKASKPELILLNPYLETGLGSFKPQKVFDYVTANYKLKEKVDGIEVFIKK